MGVTRPRVALSVSVDYEQYQEAKAWMEEGRFQSFRAVLEAALAALKNEVEAGQWPEGVYKRR